MDAEDNGITDCDAQAVATLHTTSSAQPPTSKRNVPKPTKLPENVVSTLASSKELSPSDTCNTSESTPHPSPPTLTTMLTTSTTPKAAPSTQKSNAQVSLTQSDPTKLVAVNTLC